MKHSILYTFIKNCAEQFTSKQAVCVQIMAQVMAALPEQLAKFNGVAVSRRNGAKKGAIEEKTAKQILNHWKSFIDTYFLEVASEVDMATFASLEGMEDTGKANLSVCMVSDAGEGNYTLSEGTLLRRFKAAFMTLCGDWKYLISHKASAEIREFIKRWGAAGNVGFSPAHAIAVLNGSFVPSHCKGLEPFQVLEALAKEKASIAKDLGEGEGEESEGANEGDESGETVDVPEHLKPLIEAILELKKLVLAAGNITPEQAQEMTITVQSISSGMVNPKGDETGAQAPIVKAAKATKKASAK